MNSTAIKFFNLADVAREQMAKMREGPPVLYSTGIGDVDTLLRGGVAPGEVTIVGALTSHGKTMFMLQLAYEMAFQDLKCAFLSEEMTVTALADRSIDYACEWPADQRMSEWDKSFDDVIVFFEMRSSILCCRPCRDPDTAVEAISQAVTHHGVKVVFIDYLQKLRGKGEDEVSRLTYASGVLATAAVEYGVAIVMGAQLNRSATTDNAYQPKVSHLKGASSIEQDASVILLLVWPWQLDKSKPRNEYHVYCGKNRNRGIGGNGFAQLEFMPHRQKLISAAIPDAHVFNGYERKDVF